MKRLAAFLLLSFLIVFLGSCSPGGSFLAYNATNVELSDTNFKIVARNVEGYSTAGYLFGLSYSTGFMANTLALVRIDGTAKLYDDAVRNMWKNFQEKHGDIEGKKLVMTNIRYDTDILNLLVYTKTELYIHADIVEFEE